MNPVRSALIAVGLGALLAGGVATVAAVLPSCKTEDSWNACREAAVLISIGANNATVCGAGQAIKIEDRAQGILVTCTCPKPVPVPVKP
jgi:hypothetical protein